jgi:SAM-dependent methyltransferase
MMMSSCQESDSTSHTLFCLPHRSTDPYEWYHSYHGISHLFTPFHLSVAQGLNPAKPRRILESFIPRTTTDQKKNNFPNIANCRVLIVGCGNSRLAEDMLQDGWTGGIICVDWSPVVIRQMEAKYSDEYIQKLLMEQKCRTSTKKGTSNNNNNSNNSNNRLIEFVCADILEGLAFDDESFDLIICKGSFDALITGAASNVKTLNQECHRLLKENHGAMVVVTHGNPESRIVFFENPANEWWSGVGIHNVAKPRTERRHLIEQHNHAGSK